MTNNKNIYDENTINAQNFFARFSHRNRINKIFKIVKKYSHHGKVLDYACGTGVLVARAPESIIGYEPFMLERCQTGLPIYNSLDNIRTFAPFSLICINNLFEHLHFSEIENILTICRNIISDNGCIIVNVPIEVGPVIILKEINRSFFHKEPGGYTFLEFIKAAFLGIVGKRINPNVVFMSHKGFDFRHLISFVRTKGWEVKVLSYGPLPTGCWYGNSDVYLKLTLI